MRVLDAPGLVWRKYAGSLTAVWACRSDIVKRGFCPQTQRVWHGAEPTDMELCEIEDACQRLQAEMHEWKKNPERKRPTRAIVEKGLVYFAKAGKHVKIGFTKKIGRRLSSLQISCVEPIELLGVLPGTRSLEFRCHRHFRHLHVRGEWFRDAPEITAFIEERKRMPNQMINGQQTEWHKCLTQLEKKTTS